jgi:hypothetical protein
VTLARYTAIRIAAMLGIALEDVELLHALDPRNFAAPALETEGSVWRLRRWLEAGRPEADLARLSFIGSYSVREIVRGVVRALPAPVRHYAVEAVTWFEVGRGTEAWCARAPAVRTLAGDVGHVINIDGRARDEAIRGTICHELGHGMSRTVEAEAPPPTARVLPDVDDLAVHVLRAKFCGATADELGYERARWIGSRVASELRADRQAAAWGFPHHGPGEDELRRHFAAKFDEAARLATLAEQDDDNSHSDTLTDHDRRPTMTTTPDEAHDDERPIYDSSGTRYGESTHAPDQPEHINDELARVLITDASTVDDEGHFPPLAE